MVLLKGNKVICICLLILLECCSPKEVKNNFYNKTLGLNIKVEGKGYVYVEESAKNEGFSFKILKYEPLKGSLIPNSKFYPMPYKLRQGWGVMNWKSTPFIDTKGALDLLFKYSVGDEQLKSQISTFKKLIESKGNYFAYYYRNEGDYIYSVEFYLLDVSNNQIYIIEVET